MTGKKGFTLILTILMLAVFVIPGNGIAETAEPSWDFEADVVVVGAGGAGLPAALKALRHPRQRQ